MLQQDRPSNAAYGGVSSSLRLLSNGPQPLGRKCEKDSNFNFLGSSSDEEQLMLAMAGDENRNQVRPRNQGPMGRELPTPPSMHTGVALGPLSPLSRLPCWSPLEPLPEVESGDDGGGRVPPDGAEERRIEEEMRRSSDEEREKKRERELDTIRNYSLVKGEADALEDDDEDGCIEWGNSDDEFAFSSRSSSVSSLVDGGEGSQGKLPSTWDRLCVGGPSSSEQDPVSFSSQKRSPEGTRKRHEGTEPRAEEFASSDSEWDGCIGSFGDGSTGDEVLEALWSAQDRQRFKEQEMQKHQLQLTMYRRLALIRWVRQLQARVQDQQNRLQGSFDVILTHRKELLRLGAAATAATAVSQ